MKNNIFIRAHRDALTRAIHESPANNNLPQRKSIRLKNYDYSQNGAYFITICTQNREYLFGRVGAIHESPEMILNENGKIVDSVLESLSKRFPIELDIYQIMPNHVHMIVCIVDHERAIRESPVNGNNQNVSIGDFGY